MAERDKRLLHVLARGVALPLALLSSVFELRTEGLTKTLFAHLRSNTFRLSATAVRDLPQGFESDAMRFLTGMKLAACRDSLLPKDSRQSALYITARAAIQAK